MVWWEFMIEAGAGSGAPVSDGAAASADDGSVPPEEIAAGFRVDPLTGTWVVLVQERQHRPNLPTTGCPFCPGGLEAPEPYDVRWFVNRWPALPDGRAEVVLFSPEHDQSLGSLDLAQLRRVIALWAERTRVLGGRRDVEYVLLFENRGAEVGATIAHPHGQVYAFSRVPPAALAELGQQGCPVCSELAGEGQPGPSHQRRLVAEAPGWQAWAAWAPSYPYELVLATDRHIGDLVSAEDVHEGLARVLKQSLGALDLLFDEPMPYMLWCHQRPAKGGPWPSAHLHFHIAPTHRAPGVARYVASGELGSGVMFNPVDPEAAATRLRAAAARLPEI